MADKEHLEGNIRSRFRDLEPGVPDADPNKAYARYISAAPVTPLGHTEIAVGTSPVALSGIPAGAKRLVLYSPDYAVTFTDVTGDSPSSTHGMIIPSATVFVYDSEPTTDFKLRSDSSTSVRLAYYG